MEEGKTVKGGVGKKPSNKRPKPPKGQNAKIEFIVALWIVGKWILDTPAGPIWSFQGVFDDKEKAIKACKETNWFIGPAPLNEELPDEKTVWPGVEYPFE
jgi:hypothetical protein